MPDATTLVSEGEYEVRARVGALRRGVFGRATPDPDSLALLVDAERDLAVLAAERSQVDGANGGDEAEGRFVDTRSASDLMGAATTQLEVVVDSRMAQVPTAIVHLLDGKKHPLLSGRITNVSERMRRLRVTTYVEGYSAQAVDTFEIPKKTEAVFRHLPTFFPDRIATLGELTRSTVHLVVEDIGGEKDAQGTERHWSTLELHRTEPLWLLSRNTAPLWVRDPTGGWQNLTEYLVAFVTPNVPSVMEFIRKVVDRHPEKSLVGYQGGEDKVEPQLTAIFEALKQDGGINYVNSVIAFSPDEGTATQRIRLPAESLAHREANCIDGTVLVASLIEACSMNPALVIVPGHAFVAWETWRDSGTWRYLETTMIGNSTFEEAAAFGAKTAASYEQLAVETGDPTKFQRLSVKTVRTGSGITPME